MSKKGEFTPTMYTTIAIIWNVIYGAALKGANIHQLCSTAGISLSDLNEMEKKVEGIKPIVNLWEEVLRSTKDDYFGLHLGQANNSNHLGLLGYLMHHCPSLKEVFVSLQTHQEKISGWVSYNMKQERDKVILYYTIDPVWLNVSPHTARHAIDVAMSGTITMMKILTGIRVLPVLVELNAVKIVHVGEYEKIYNTMVLYDKPYNTLVFKKEDFNLPVLSYDQSLYTLFNRLLAEQEPFTGQRHIFANQVKRILSSEFNGQVPPLGVVASHLNLSNRSFQRKLRQEGFTYRGLGTEMKKELAVNLLENSNAKINAIAEVLGYAEPSAFRKAFKTWTNATPIQVKKDKVVSQKLSAITPSSGVNLQTHL
jgi:AraC-like DNA-binding protein